MTNCNAHLSHDDCCSAAAKPWERAERELRLAADLWGWGWGWRWSHGDEDGDGDGGNGNGDGDGMNVCDDILRNHITIVFIVQNAASY